jgi:hypothetical protein
MVGLNHDGKAKPCVVIYDYLKLMSADQITARLAEHQALRFLTQKLKAFAGRYGVPILTFAQMNRDGLDYEDTRVIRGSDGILDDITSFSIFKWKSDEERAEVAMEHRKYTHKLIPLICRHGPAVKYGDYINVETDFARALLREGPYRSELESGGATNKGVLSDERPDESVLG